MGRGIDRNLRKRNVLGVELVRSPDFEGWEGQGVRFYRVRIEGRMNFDHWKWMTDDGREGHASATLTKAVRDWAGLAATARPA